MPSGARSAGSVLPPITRTPDQVTAPDAWLRWTGGHNNARCGRRRTGRWQGNPTATVDIVDTQTDATDGGRTVPVAFVVPAEVRRHPACRARHVLPRGGFRSVFR